MATFAIKYDPRNILITKMLDVISHIKGVEVLEEETLTPEEMKLIEKSKKSGIHTDVDKLKKILKSKL